MADADHSISLFEDMLLRNELKTISLSDYVFCFSVCDH